MRHSIKTEILQKALNYLASRPFNEVNSLINEITSDAQPIKSEPEEVVIAAVETQQE